MALRSFAVFSRPPALVLFFGVLAPLSLSQGPPGLTKPEAFFGFRPGAERRLFDYEQLIAYLKRLESESPRVKLVEAGRSPLGRKMYICFLSAEENIRNLEALKGINRRLALDPEILPAERKNLVYRGRVFVLARIIHQGPSRKPGEARQFGHPQGRAPEAC